jgi:hypothetical protein
LQITNRRGSSSPDHGQGYAYVRTAGTGSGYDPSYQSVLKGNTGQEVVWTFNMRRDNPEGSSSGFSCSSTSSQNYVTLGLAYVLAADSAAGLQASASTCSPSATSVGYAVVLGGTNRLRLVRFNQGLRNGTLTNIVESSTFTITNYFSVRVTYRATDDLWRLEVRNDGTSNFAVPTGGSAYGFTGTGTDATYVNIPLDYTGPYFQSGCTGLCSAKYTALFDNVSVGLRCAN